MEFKHSGTNFGSVSALFAALALFILSSCAGVGLTNRTNQPTYAGGAEEPYNSEQDIFLLGAPSLEYLLKVRRKNGVDRSSIRPKVFIDGVGHPMNMVRNWTNDVSYWGYDRASDCPAVITPVADSNYAFLVYYDRPNIFIKSSPGRIPSAGSQYTSRILNLGFGFVPTPPFPNHQSELGVIYDQNCWQTGLGCVPTWKHSMVVDFGIWPGPSGLYEHTLVLINPEPSDVTITGMTLGSLGQDTSSFNLFEIANTNFPITIPACGGSSNVTLRYKPGFYQAPSYTLGLYRHKLLLRSQVLWPNFPSPFNGPWIRINYETSYNPS